MRDRFKCFSEMKETAQTAFLRCSKENQELAIDKRAVSVENPSQKPN